MGAGPRGEGLWRIGEELRDSAGVHWIRETLLARFEWVECEWIKVRRGRPRLDVSELKIVYRGYHGHCTQPFA
ncbi:MAG: hypothetical protein M3N18_11165, partial [Actinomycetota bacterium]|nr:hypothetical protein [Actinomycetota bacterium]